MCYHAKDLSKGTVLLSEEGVSVLVMNKVTETCVLAIEEGTGYGVLKRSDPQSERWEFEPCYSANVPLQSYY
jgi:hypothetical protein